MESNDYIDWDIKFKNENGDTALHIAISKDAGIDELRSLLERGADVNVTNDNGKTPFECINHGSWKTAIKLLQLEKDFDLRDDKGDSFLHVLMDRVGDSIWGIRRTEGFGVSEQEQMIEKFWNHILENGHQFAINLNSQNKYGCTPLHVAADYMHSMKSLEVMLSHFEHVNPFICDEDNENFLHKYCLRDRTTDSAEFQDRMLSGKLRYLPKTTLAKLLSSQNTDKNTPLHILIKDCDGKSLCTFEGMIESGTDLNICDSIGDTALHCILKKYSKSLEVSDMPEDVSEFLYDFTDRVIQCLVKNGADVNAVNKKGESPIFLASKQKHTDTLVTLGANVNLQNGLSQTPLLYLVSKENTELDTLENLLKQGADVFVADVHGSTVLHYIAWHGYHKDFLPTLKRYKAKATRDNLGHLPCDVAYMQGHQEIFDEICDCDDDSHTEREHFRLTSDVIDLSELVKKPEEFQEKFDRIKHFRGEEMSKVLSLPGIGAVNFEGETADIKNVTKEIVENICKKFKEKNDFWKCRILQSGSVGENTKVNYPNEFDFVIILENLGEICYVDEQRSCQDKGYAYLKLKPEYATEELKKFFTDENYLDPETVRIELDDILEELYITEDIFQHPNISFVEGENKEIHRPTFNFSFYWKGCLHKHLLVDIDLVPACQVKNWWPENCNLDNLQGNTKELKEEGAILLLQSELHGKDHDCKVRISAMSAEKEHMLNLPQVGRDAYKVCKILCDRRICPDLHVKADIFAKKVITSYMLKNTVLYVMDDIKATAEMQSIEPSEKKIKLDKSFELQTIVRKTFLKLLKFAKDENLPSFVFPWQNVFIFNSNILPEDNHYFCAFRYAFLKVILSLLGEVQEFSDIDEESCSLAVGKRSGLEESDDSNEDEEDYNVIEWLNEGRGEFVYYSLL